MSRQWNRNVWNRALALLISGCGAAYGGDITYYVHQTVGLFQGTVSGTVETDGSNGTLAAANILGWNLQITCGNPGCELTPFGLTTANSSLTLTGDGLSATSAALLFDFESSGADGSVEFLNSSSQGWALSPPEAPGFEAIAGGFGTEGPIYFSPQPYIVGLALSSDVLQGGSSSDPVFLAGSLVGQVSGTIAGMGAQDYYSFYWSGGAFHATASIGGAPAGASYLYSAGVAGSCGSLASQTLDGSDGFAGAISLANLAPGQYCIGLDADNPNDPSFALTFDTPVGGAPEPAGFLLLPSAVAALGLLRRARARG